MSTSRKSALLVVDVQVGVIDGTWNAEKVVANISKVVAAARAAGAPVIWVQHDDDELVSGSDEWHIVPVLSPQPEELIVPKHFNSAFQQTELKQKLQALGVNHVVLCGAASNWCIRATAYSALECGFDLSLVADAHTTEDMDMRDGSVIPARDIVRELNVGIHWVTYPDRQNESVPTAEVSFS